MKDIRAAVVTFNSPVGKSSDNLDRMGKWVKEASDKGASIICFPEIFKCLTLLIFIVILLAFLAAWILLKIQVKIINDINSNEGNE